MSDTKTTRAEANAIKLLRAKGYSVLPPNASAPIYRMADQCEYPLREGAAGDCCTNSTRRNRKTRFGTMWLCEDHFGVPVSELFDERVQP